jgi:GLPGLI family protein
MKKILILMMFSVFFNGLKAQFIGSGEIEFEVKSNLKKSLGSSAWAEMMKDKLPTFKTIFYTYQFNKNKSRYAFSRWENKEAINDMFSKGDENSVWYVDHESRKYKMNKDVFGSLFQIADTFPKIDWKLTNENRIIAGYNCRKAIGKIMDSVYIFAFYTDEITISGGPCTVHGLPGMILGMTIPRLYTSWIATKVKASNNINISPLADEKIIYAPALAQKTVTEKTRDWMDESDPESGKWLKQVIWSLLL